MRLIDADELMEHVWRDKLDSRELISKMIDNAPTIPEPNEMTAEEYRQRMIQAFHNADTGELLAICVRPTEKEFEHLEWLLKNHYKKEPYEDCISRQAVLDKLNRLIEVERLQGTDEMGYGRERVSAYENMKFEIESEYLYPSVSSSEKPNKCEDAISRQAAIGALESIGSLDTEADQEYARSVFETLPSVTPQPRTGRRAILKDEYGDVTKAVCSCCDKNGNHKWAFCPNCGARMQEVKRDVQIRSCPNA